MWNFWDKQLYFIFKHNVLTIELKHHEYCIVRSTVDDGIWALHIFTPAEVGKNVIFVKAE